MNTSNVTSNFHIRHVAGSLAFILPLFAFAADPSPVIEVRLQVFLDQHEVSGQKVVAVSTERASVELQVGAFPPIDNRAPSSNGDAAYLVTDRFGRSMIP